MNNNYYFPQQAPPPQYNPWVRPEPMGAERGQMKKIGNRLGVGMLVYIVVAFLLSFLMLFGRKAGLWDEQQDYILDQAIMAGIYILYILIPFILYYKICGFRMNQLSLHRPRKGFFIPAAAFGAGLAFLSNIPNNIVVNLIGLTGYEPIQPDLPVDQSSTVSIVLYLVSIAVLPALLEEFVCRGLILQPLRKYGDWPAIFISSGIFALLHMNFSQILFAFIIGVFTAFLVIKTGSIWTGVAIHFLNNLIAGGLSLAPDGLSETKQALFGLGLLSAAFLITLLSFLILRLKDRSFFSAKTLFRREFTTAKSMGVLLATPCMIIGMILLFLLSFISMQKVG